MEPEKKSPFKAKRITRSYRQAINADPQTVFPLICPVREAEWLDGWDYDLIYSESGYAEEGCVFISRQEGENDTIWVITKHNKDRGIVEFARITPGSRATKLTVSIKDEKEGKSWIEIAYTFTALNEEGNRFIEDLTEERFNEGMKFWEASMNHYLETGELLKAPAK